MQKITVNKMPNSQAGVSEGVALLSGDFARPSDCGLYGHLEDVSFTGLKGWLVDLRGHFGLVTAYIEGHPVASGSLSVWRDDLAAIVGSPKTYGFFLSWRPWDLRELKFSPNGCYPLIFSFNGVFFAFANYSEISGGVLAETLKSLPKKPKPGSPRQFQDDYTRVRDADTAIGIREEPVNRTGVKIVAFYSPKYYPVAANETEARAGFSDWTLTAKARPLFRGHRQPRLPGELGFYDLRLAATRQAQTELARSHGIYGFCYYYHLRQGRAVWETPLKETLGCAESDFPFCICVVNEDWEACAEPGSNSAGLSSEAVEGLVPILQCGCYIQIGDAPLLLLARADLLADKLGCTRYLREILGRYGISKVHLCASGLPVGEDPHISGFDSGFELTPNASGLRPNNELGRHRDLRASVHRYADLARQGMNEANPHAFPTVWPGFDNSPEAAVEDGEAPLIFTDATPLLYETWLRAALDRARAAPAEERFVFVNAWNDWAKGACLEPDAANGRAWLEATRRAVTRQTDWPELLACARSAENLTGEAKAALLADLESRFTAMRLRLSWFEDGAFEGDSDFSSMAPGLPLAVQNTSVIHAGSICVDQVNTTRDPVWVSARAGAKLFCTGWGFCQGAPLRPNTPTWMLLLASEADKILYHGFIERRLERSDVASGGLDIEATWFSGFRQSFDMKQVATGAYRLALLTLYPDGARVAASNVHLELE